MRGNDEKQETEELAEKQSAKQSEIHEESDDGEGTRDYGSDASDEYVEPDEQAMKEEGNVAYRQGDYDQALVMWKAGLKETLKKSCRGIMNSELYELCFTFRLNMAQALVKKQQWRDALEQLEVVLNQQPHNLKALYRKAQVHLALQEWDLCEEAANAGLAVDKGNIALRRLLTSVAREKAVQNSKGKVFYAKMFGPDDMSEQSARSSSSRTDPPKSFVASVDVDSSQPLGVRWEGPGCSDDAQSDLWIGTHTGDELSNMEGKRPLILSLPFTLLQILSEGYNVSTMPENKTIFERLLQSTSMMIHVVGVRGDAEMDCMWKSIIQRLPNLKALSLFFIGFMDETDLWGLRLNEGVTSPPMTKDMPENSGKMTCRLFKGYYQAFMQAHSGVLTDAAHCYHPDIILIAEPSFSRHFDTWIPALVPIIQNRILCIITGYSAVDIDSHEAVNIPPVLESLGVDYVAPLHRNPYAVKIMPDSSIGPMPCFQGFNVPSLQYIGPSAKHAVVCAFRGGSSSGLPQTDEDVQALKKSLRKADVDVEVGETAIREFQTEVLSGVTSLQATTPGCCASEEAHPMPKLLF